MNDSILETIRKMLGPDSTYTYFDPDIIVLINSAISTLVQLGVGPVEGFSITSNHETWSDLLDGYDNLEMVKEYVYLRVKVVFDPPNSGYVLDAYKNEIKELEWRINSQVDYKW